MAQGYFRIPKGLEIDGQVQFITGDGAPGTSGDSTTVSVGSFYADYTNAKFYKKTAAGSGTDKWTELIDKDYVDSLVNGLSWREPALVLDGTSYADITAAETAANVADTVDGITIAANDRILFTNLTSGNDNVYIVSGSTGAWTFTEDPYNTATDGDALMIESGTHADDQYAYNGTAWVRIAGSANNLELGYIRDFIGKSAAGVELPTYSSTNFVTDSNDLETSIGDLDTEIGANVTDGDIILASNTVNANIKAIDDEVTLQHHKSTLTGVTTQQALDSIPTTSADVVKWIVRAYDATNSRWYAGEIIAMHDGAGNTDLTIYAELRLGSGKIHGLTWDVDVNAGNLRLLVTSTDSIDVTSKRVSVF